jgi:hypothetical protein
LTTQKHPQIIRRIAQAWLVLVIVGSLQPARPATVVGLHREIHWLAFAGLASLLLFLCGKVGQEISAATAICFLGLSLEYVQHLVYRKSMEWRDVRDDIMAALVAFALYRLAIICKTVFAAARCAGESGTVSPAEAGRL